jgi:hypothetical protein
MAARQLAAILENKLSAITPDRMSGLSPNFNRMSGMRVQFFSSNLV